MHFICVMCPCFYGGHHLILLLGDRVNKTCQELAAICYMAIILLDGTSMLTISLVLQQLAAICVPLLRMDWQLQSTGLKQRPTGPPHRNTGYGHIGPPCPVLQNSLELLKFLSIFKNTRTHISKLNYTWK